MQYFKNTRERNARKWNTDEHNLAEDMRKCVWGGLYTQEKIKTIEYRCGSEG